MKQRYLLIHLVVWSLLVQSGCQKQARPPEQFGHVAATPKTTPAKAIEPEKQGPRIRFESVEHDFGRIGPGLKQLAEFKFTNAGDGLLKITGVRKCCGVVARLDKTEYAPGESGVLTVEYRSARSPATVKKHLYVSSNDVSAPSVELTIKAIIVLRVDWQPRRLRLAVRDENLLCPEITLTSRDGKPFSTVGFASTGDCITAEVDGSPAATKIVLQPRIDIEKLRKIRRGHIVIEIARPDPNAPNEKVTVPFEVLRRFSVKPAVLHVVYEKAAEPVTKNAWVLNNYNEDFEIESTSSEQGYIKVLSQDKLANGYQFSLQITPPPIKGTGRFADLLYINIKEGNKLAIACRGIYRARTQKSTEDVESTAEIARRAGTD